MSAAANPFTSRARRASSRFAASLAVALIATVAPVDAPASAATPTVDRQAGANRYATAVDISQRTFPTPGVPVAYVATGGNFPDALAAGPVAAKRGGPLLLLRLNDVPHETAAELDRLNPAEIVIAGGTGVVSAGVEAQLKQYAPVVKREWGANRYATAANIALQNFSAGVDVVYVATGTNFPDALAAGPSAAIRGGAVLLVKGNALPPETANALAQLRPDRIVIAGGTSVVSPAVETELARYAPVTRESGANRYATAANISAASFAPGVDVVYVATGANFPDALAAGPAASKSGAGPVLLVRSGSIPPEAAAELRRLRPDRIVIAGGTAVVGLMVQSHLTSIGLEPTGPTQAATVHRVIDGDTIEVVVNGAVFDVRYIGIDTPEIYSGVEWLGPEAAAANTSLLAGGQVLLEKDVSETDQYGRLLRYVWVNNGGVWALINLELLRLGYASVTTYPPDVKYVDAHYILAQQAAQAAGLGIWGTPPSTPPPSGGCDPSYPSVCIPPPPPDLDCGDITFRRFTVLAPDPHGFDGDRDGIGCES